MRRPWQVWFVFALSVAAMIPALLWLSFRAMALEREQRIARAVAAQQENIASVLLRLDTQVSPLLLQETSRPYYDYEPTRRLPATKVNQGVNDDTVYEIPSPLVQEEQPDVMLHFEVFADNVIVCPQAVADDINCAEACRIAPSKIDEYRNRLAQVSSTVSFQSLANRLPHPSPSTSSQSLANYAWLDKVSNLDLQRQQRFLQENSESPQQLQMSQGQGGPPPQALDGLAPSPPQQAYAPAAEESFNRAAYNQTSRSKLQMSKPMQSEGAQTAQMAAAPEEVVREGQWEPLWYDQKLFLVRNVQRRRLQSIQVCWLDSDALQAKLTEEARTLIPEASLRPVNTRDPDEKLANLDLMKTLPLALIVSPPVTPSASLSPTIIMAWLGFLMTAFVVGLLLYSVISLSERRAAFVTSVTHELRTPLTTFRMYSEMLAEGMVSDETSRKRYLETLRSEADRLGHLVENVLSYARLERGRGAKAKEKVALSPLIERATSRVADRAAQAGKILSLEIDQNIKSDLVNTDPGAVEQIVMNLIDNACKYAQPASDSRVIVRLSALPRHQGFSISVRDFGPGIRKGLFSGLFQPFSKTAQEAAISAPGVGLGLALCSRLARQLDGKLVHHNAEGGGAQMELHLFKCAPAN
jgi:signal transduction histidine kinase